MNNPGLERGAPSDRPLRGDHGLLDAGEHGLDAGDIGDVNLGAASTPTPARRRVGTGALLFGVVALASFGSLWSMRAIGRASADVGTPSEAGRLVESYLNERTKSQAQPTTAELASAPLPIGSAVDLQVPRERLLRDPFATPWRSAGITPVDQGAAVVPVAATPESRLSEWEALVDAGARDFVVESVLIAPNPAMSIVSMNGGVFRVGESVMFADHAIRYEIRAVDATSVTLAATNEELSHERLVRLAVRERH